MNRIYIISGMVAVMIIVALLFAFAPAPNPCMAGRHAYAAPHGGILCLTDKEAERYGWK